MNDTAYERAQTCFVFPVFFFFLSFTRFGTHGKVTLFHLTFQAHGTRDEHCENFSEIGAYTHLCILLSPAPF